MCIYVKMRRKLKKLVIFVVSITLFMIFAQSFLTKKQIRHNTKLSFVLSGGEETIEDNKNENDYLQREKNNEYFYIQAIKSQSEELGTELNQLSTADQTIPQTKSEQKIPMNGKEEENPQDLTTVTTEEVSMRNNTTRSEIIPTTYNGKSFDCPLYSDNLVGPLHVNASKQPTEDEALQAGGEDLVDGCYVPTKCSPLQNVAIIIPYKNRKQHLITLLYHLHPILQRQLISYCVFVAEQFDNGSFNKARVMNAAFEEITTKYSQKFDCVIFHDVDMLLEDDRNIHLCGDSPKHLSPAIDKFNYTLDYGTKFGGVTAISVDHYRKVNGHSNKFWGWGGEDNDMEMRIASNNLTIIATNVTYGRYKMIPHDHPWQFSPLYGVGSYLQTKRHWSVKGIDKSGLQDIKYNMKYTTKTKLWTKLTIDIRTVLVNKATIRFYGNRKNWLVFTSPSLATEDEMSDPERTKDIAAPIQEKCTYREFTGKTVNKTLGIREKLTYGRMYDSLLEAQTRCDKLQALCGSVVQEHPGRFSLRASANMHEKYLRYGKGLVNQVEVTEEHHTISVNVKICSGDSSYLNFFPDPIIMAGDSVKGASPAYFVEFKIRVFHNINTTLMYNSDLMTAHKAIMMEKVDSQIEETASWDTLGRVYTSRTVILNMSDPESVKKVLPDGFSSIQDLITRGDGILTIKTPLNGILRHPGCYICRSTLVDGSGAAILQWKWWFELRAETTAIEEEILNKQLKKAKITSIGLTAEVEQRRETWKKYHDRLKKKKLKEARNALPHHVENMVNKYIPKL